jgi:hypothetical protein
MHKIKRWLIAAELITLAFVCTFGLMAEDPPPKPEPKKDIDKVLAMIDKLAKETELLTDKKLKEKVPAEPQAIEDFKKYLQQQLDEALPPDKATRQSIAMAKIGLLPEGYDTRKALMDLLKSNAGAHYDPDRKKVFILMCNLPIDQLKPMIVHEYTHAIQDQYYDLKKLLGQAINLNEDKATAIAFLVEGHATYIMTLYSFKMMGMDPAQLDPAIIKQSFQVMNSIGRDTLIEQNELMAKNLGESGKEIADAMKELKTTPDYLFWGLTAPYIKGAYSMSQILTQDKNLIDKLFKELPDSTEQMLHPQKRLIEKRDYPIELTLPEFSKVLGKSWEKVYSDVLGEFNFNILFESFLDKNEKISRITTGWDGDRYAVYRNPDSGKKALFWATTWDTEKDAQEFFEAYPRIIQKKYPKGSAKSNQDTLFTWELPSKEIAGCEIKGKDVIIFECPPESESQVRTLLFDTNKTLDSRDKN